MTDSPTKTPEKTEIKLNQPKFPAEGLYYTTSANGDSKNNYNYNNFIEKNSNLYDKINNNITSYLKLKNILNINIDEKKNQIDERLKDIHDICLELFFKVNSKTQNTPNKEGSNSETKSSPSDNEMNGYTNLLRSITDKGAFFKGIYNDISNGIKNKEIDGIKKYFEDEQEVNNNEAEIRIKIRKKIAKLLLQKIEEIEKKELPKALIDYFLDSSVMLYCNELFEYSKIIIKDHSLANHNPKGNCLRIFPGLDITKEDRNNKQKNLEEKITEIDKEILKYHEKYSNLLDIAANICSKQLEYYNKNKNLPYYLQKPYLGEVVFMGKKIEQILSKEQGEALAEIEKSLNKTKKEYPLDKQDSDIPPKLKYSSKALVNLGTGQGKTFLIKLLEEQIEKQADASGQQGNIKLSIKSLDLNSKKEELTKLISKESKDDEKNIVFLDEEFFYHEKFANFLIGNKESIETGFTLDQQSAKNPHLLHEMFIWQLRKHGNVVVRVGASESLEFLNNKKEEKKSKLVDLKKELEKINEEIEEIKVKNSLSLNENDKYNIDKFLDVLNRGFYGAGGITAHLNSLNDKNREVLKELLKKITGSINNNITNEEIDIIDSYSKAQDKANSITIEVQKAIIKLLTQTKEGLSKSDENIKESTKDKESEKSIITKNIEKVQNKIIDFETRIEQEKARRELLKNKIKEIENHSINSLEENFNLEDKLLDDLAAIDKDNTQIILPDYEFSKKSEDVTGAVIDINDFTNKLKEKDLKDLTIILPYKSSDSLKYCLVEFVGNKAEIKEDLTKDQVEKEVKDKSKKIVTFYDSSNAIGGDYGDLSFGTNKQIWYLTDEKKLNFHYLLQYNGRNRSPNKDHKLTINLGYKISKELLLESLDDNTLKIDNERNKFNREAKFVVTGKKPRTSSKGSDGKDGTSSKESDSTDGSNNPDSENGSGGGDEKQSSDSGDARNQPQQNNDASGENKKNDERESDEESDTLSEIDYGFNPDDDDVRSEGSLGSEDRDEIEEEPEAHNENKIDKPLTCDNLFDGEKNQDGIDRAGSGGAEGGRSGGDGARNMQTTTPQSSLANSPRGDRAVNGEAGGTPELPANSPREVGVGNGGSEQIHTPQSPVSSPRGDRAGSVGAETENGGVDVVANHQPPNSGLPAHGSRGSVRKLINKFEHNENKPTTPEDETNLFDGEKDQASRDVAENGEAGNNESRPQSPVNSVSEVGVGNGGSEQIHTPQSPVSSVRGDEAGNGGNGSDQNQTPISQSPVRSASRDEAGSVGAETESGEAGGTPELPVSSPRGANAGKVQELTDMFESRSEQTLTPQSPVSSPRGDGGSPELPASSPRGAETPVAEMKKVFENDGANSNPESTTVLEKKSDNSNLTQERSVNFKDAKKIIENLFEPKTPNEDKAGEPLTCNSLFDQASRDGAGNGGNGEVEGVRDGDDGARNNESPTQSSASSPRGNGGTPELPASSPRGVSDGIEGARNGDDGAGVGGDQNQTPISQSSASSASRDEAGSVGNGGVEGIIGGAEVMASHQPLNSELPAHHTRGNVRGDKAGEPLTCNSLFTNDESPAGSASEVGDGAGNNESPTQSPVRSASRDEAGSVGAETENGEAGGTPELPASSPRGAKTGKVQELTNMFEGRSEQTLTPQSPSANSAREDEGTNNEEKLIPFNCDVMFQSKQSEESGSDSESVKNLIEKFENWEFNKTQKIKINNKEHERWICDTKLETLSEKEIALNNDSESQPKSSTEAENAINMNDKIENIWFNCGGDRKNKFRILQKLINIVPQNEKKINEAQNEISELFIDIIAKSAIDSGITFEQALNITKYAKKNGGVGNLFDNDKTYKVNEDNDINISGIEPKKAREFSKRCQFLAEKCGIYSGRTEKFKDVGLRLTFFNLDKIDLLNEKMANESQTTEKLKGKMEEIKKITSNSLEQSVSL